MTQLITAVVNGATAAMGIIDGRLTMLANIHRAYAFYQMCCVDRIAVAFGGGRLDCCNDRLCGVANSQLQCL